MSYQFIIHYSKSYFCRQKYILLIKMTWLFKKLKLDLLLTFTLVLHQIVVIHRSQEMWLKFSKNRLNNQNLFFIFQKKFWEKKKHRLIGFVWILIIQISGGQSSNQQNFGLHWIFIFNEYCLSSILQWNWLFPYLIIK